MKRIKIALCVAAFGVALGLGVGDAHASGGIAAQAAQLPVPARAELAKEIEAYRASHPEAFEAVRDVRGHRPEFYKRFRNPVPVVGRELKRLGPSALLPMLNALAFEAPPRENLTDVEWTALTVGMLEAVGALRDARSGPVLRAVFEGAGARAPVQKAAAEAMGQLCGDAELASLTRHTAASDALRIPAIQGLGQCRRLESAKHLAGMLSAGADDATTTALAGALGTVGSSWAWKAMGPSAEATGMAVREIAAKALVAGFVKHTGEPRAQMRQALRVVEHKGTLELIAKARPAADAETTVALDALTKQLSKSR